MTRFKDSFQDQNADKGRDESGSLHILEKAEQMPLDLPPTLSVVIPAFNVQDFISPAIESVLSQSFMDMEVIVVDDGSTDATLQMIFRFQDPRIRVVQKENGGLAAARNTGIREARGRYIALLDGDDVWFADYAMRHVAALESDARIGITYSYLAYIDEAGKRTGQLLGTKLKSPTLREMIYRNHIHSHVVVRRKCFEEAGLFNENLRACEDHEMWVRILHRTSFCLRLVPYILAGYRIRASSLTMLFEHQIENARKVADIFEREIGISKLLRRRCLAEDYRICSRKALSNGQRQDAARLMGGTLRECPWIIFTDLRALGTFCLLLLEFALPERVRRVPYHATRRLMRIAYRELTGSDRQAP